MIGGLALPAWQSILLSDCRREACASSDTPLLAG